MVKAAQLDPTQVGCDHCPIQATWPELRHPRMRMSGNRTDPRVLILGEAPGENEDARGAIFIGKSGTELRAHLPAKHLDEIGFQNTVRCRPTQDGKNRPPTAAEIHCCGALLEEDIESRPSITAILGCGGVPLRRFAPELTILKAHGIQFPVEVAGRALWFFPTFHPSFVLRMEAERTGRVRPVFEQDLKRFWREHTRWGTPSIARLSPDDVIIPRTREEAMALLARMQDPIAVDIETADADGPTLQPFSVGAYILSAAFSDGQTTIAFSVEHEEWDNPWGYDVLLNTVAARRWIAHNAGFELAWFRFNVPGERFGRFDDTMAMSRIFHRRSLLPLDAVSRIHLGVNIKALMPVNAKKILDYSLEAVLHYNGLDAQASALIYRKLQHVTRDPNYQELLRSVDSTTGMELMGLPVNIDTAKTAKA